MPQIASVVEVVVVALGRRILATIMERSAWSCKLLNWMDPRCILSETTPNCDGKILQTV
jgi:hypothetical protein